MTYRLGILGLILVVGAGAGAWVIAQPPGGPGGPGGGPPPSPLFEALDLDKDGKISAEEISKASQSLKTLDKNGDGELTRDELFPRGLRGGMGKGGEGKKGSGRKGGPEGKGGSEGKGPPDGTRPPLENQADRNAAQAEPSGDKLPETIAWYTDLFAGLAEAKRTGKPILLMSAAPSCGGVPGMW